MLALLLSVVDHCYNVTFEQVRLVEVGCIFASDDAWLAEAILEELLLVEHVLLCLLLDARLARLAVMRVIVVVEAAPVA